MKFLSLDCIKKTFVVYPVSMLMLFMWTCFNLLSKDGVFPAGWNVESPQISSLFFLLLPLVISLEVRSFQNFGISNSYFGKFAKDFSIAALFGVILFYGLFHDKSLAFQIFLWLLCPIFCLFLIIPFLGENFNVDQKIYQFGFQVFSQGFFAALYVFIFGTGLFLFFISLDHLFDIKLTYMNVFIVEICFIFPSLLLMMMPQNLKSDLKEIPEKWIMFHLFGLIPILVLSGVNLHAYFLKILIQGVFPKGMITFMVIIYGIVGYKVYWLMHVIDERPKVMSLFYKIFPYTMILPLFMMAQALYMRIDQYGFTYPRIYMCTLWVSLILMALQTGLRFYVSLRSGLTMFVLPFLLTLQLLIFGTQLKMIFLGV